MRPKVLIFGVLTSLIASTVIFGASVAAAAPPVIAPFTPISCKIDRNVKREGKDIVATAKVTCNKRVFEIDAYVDLVPARGHATLADGLKFCTPDKSECTAKAAIRAPAGATVATYCASAWSNIYYREVDHYEENDATQVQAHC